MFNGVPELLDGLVAQGKRMAVATSRMEAKCIDMVHELGLSQFEAVIGMNPPQGRETKADSVRDALAALGATADDAVMIGDRFNDVEGAHAMGVPCIGIYSARRRRVSMKRRVPMRWCTRWLSLLNFSLSRN